jgi:hypothetical protein
MNVHYFPAVSSMTEWEIQFATLSKLSNDNNATISQRQNLNLDMFHSCSATVPILPYLVSYSSVKLHVTFQDDMTSERARRYSAGGRDAFWSRCDSGICATAKPEFLSDGWNLEGMQFPKPASHFHFFRVRATFLPSVESVVIFNRLDISKFSLLSSQRNTCLNNIF